ncbi:MAG TPA: hypothetical protein VL899_12865 [Alphaproteobacteria bacterium]|nr:hypothetical protein [Alphaproteobacteria bacterium]
MLKITGGGPAEILGGPTGKIEIGADICALVENLVFTQTGS